MVVSFAYVLACRVLKFIVLLVRRNRSKELEIVVLRHEWLRRIATRVALDDAEPEPSVGISVAVRYSGARRRR